MPLPAMLESCAKLPLLSAKAQEDLVDLAQSGDRKAREKLVRHNIRLVLKYAQKSYLNETMYDEMVQLGLEGLNTAVDKFKASAGIPFSLYAQYWVKARIFHHAKITRRYYDDHQPLEWQVPDYLEDEAYEAIVDEEATPLDEELINRDFLAKKGALVRQCLPFLGERERIAFESRWLQDTPMRLDDLGKTLKLSREGARRVSLQALRKMMRLLRAPVELEEIIREVSDPARRKKVA